MDGITFMPFVREARKEMGTPSSAKAKGGAAPAPAPASAKAASVPSAAAASAPVSEEVLALTTAIAKKGGCAPTLSITPNTLSHKHTNTLS